MQAHQLPTIADATIKILTNRRDTAMRNSEAHTDILQKHVSRVRAEAYDLAIDDVKRAKADVDAALERGDGIAETVDRFVGVMYEKLHRNKHKGTWHKDNLQKLLELLRREVEELAAELGLAHRDPRAIVRECADISNFALMIADVAGGLTELALAG